MRLVLPPMPGWLPWPVDADIPNPTDLSDAEWELAGPLIPPAKPGGRPALHQRREIAGALAY